LFVGEQNMSASRSSPTIASNQRVLPLSAGTDHQGCGVGSPVIRLRLRILAISIILLQLRLRTDSDLQLY